MANNTPEDLSTSIDPNAAQRLKAYKIHSPCQRLTGAALHEQVSRLIKSDGSD